MNDEGNPLPFSAVRSTALTDYQNELEKEWLDRVKERYPVWINEDLFKAIQQNK
jgi:hypothetical protein